MSNWKQLFSFALALAGGFALSFSGLGILWVGTRWPYQFLMFFPFLLLSFGAARFIGNGAFLVLVGAAPIGALLVQFRDNNDSHLMPILVVGSWALGTLIGGHLGGRFKTKPAGVA